MDVAGMIQTVRRHPHRRDIGMVASHLGVVRGWSLTGKTVEGVDVQFDRDIVLNIINDIKKMDGIVDVKIDFSEGRLSVGEPIMAVVVAGDTREHVFPALLKAVNRMKSEACHKQELMEE